MKDLSEYHEIIDEASSTVYNELKKQSPYPYGFDGLNVLINTASIGFGAAGLVKTAAGIPALIKQGKNIGQIIKNGISITSNTDDVVEIAGNGVATLGMGIPKILSIAITSGMAKEVAGAYR